MMNNATRNLNKSAKGDNMYNIQVGCGANGPDQAAASGSWVVCE